MDRRAWRLKRVSATTSWRFYLKTVRHQRGHFIRRDGFVVVEGVRRSLRPGSRTQVELDEVCRGEESQVGFRLDLRRVSDESDAQICREEWRRRERGKTWRWHMIVLISVTRFGHISPLWQNLSLAYSWRVYFILVKFRTKLDKILWY